MPSLRNQIIVALTAALAAGAPCHAYSLSGEHWASSPIVMQLQLGSSNGPLIDGSADWATAAEDALATWNSYLNNIKFSVVRDSTAPIARGNSYNNVIWSSTVYGTDWDPRALAVTLTRYSASTHQFVEADVLFNNTLKWNSYRGALKTAATGGRLYDFHRVALHEFGHVLGLDHPDAVGQTVSAVMNSTTSDLDALTADDITGAQSIYDSTQPVDTGRVSIAAPASYSISGSTVTLSAAGIENSRTSASGTLQLELWAMPSHFDNGLPTGSVELGVYRFPNALPAGAGFSGGSVSVPYTAPPPGAYYVALLLTEYTGSSSDGGFTIRDGIEFTTPLALSTDVVAPVITTQPASQSVKAGQAVTFSVTATGSALTYQWYKDGKAIAGATSTTLTIGSPAAIDAGDYTVVVSNGAGAVTSSAATLSVSTSSPATTDTSRLTNLSVRSTAGSGAQTLIAGFTISGTGTKQVLLRGIGPTLGSFGVAGALTDPQLQLYNSAGTKINENDDWGGTASLTNAFNAANAFGLAANSKDAAMLVPLASGTYTVQVTTASGTGVAMIESYDLDPTSPPTRFSNLSVRSIAGSDSATLIVGFAVSGNSARKVLIRGIGPTLANFGVGGVLSDPKLQVFNSAGTSIAQNDDWGGTAALSDAFTAVGAFMLPAGSHDAAIELTLQPGAYTVQLTGADATPGVAMVEVYEVP